MTKYCDIHGPVEVNEAFFPVGSVVVPVCEKCKTVLSDIRPNPVPVAVTVSDVRTSSNVTVNAREAEEKSAKEMRQGAFLANYEGTGRVLHAAAAAGVDKRQYFRWMKEPDFAAAFGQSKLVAIQRLEDEAVRRAGEGPVMSDRLLIKLLESLKPEVYNQPTRHEHSGSGGKPIEMNVSPSEQLLSRIAGLVTRTSETPSGSESH
jgi:hypothetical protein